MVQFGDPVNYGVIKRIEALAGVTFAEIEMVCKSLVYHVYTDIGSYVIPVYRTCGLPGVNRFSIISSCYATCSSV